MVTRVPTYKLHLEGNLLSKNSNASCFYSIELCYQAFDYVLSFTKLVFEGHYSRRKKLKAAMAFKKFNYTYNIYNNTLIPYITAFSLYLYNVRPLVPQLC